MGNGERKTEFSEQEIKCRKKQNSADLPMQGNGFAFYAFYTWRASSFIQADHELSAEKAGKARLLSTCKHANPQTGQGISMRSEYKAQIRHRTAQISQKICQGIRSFDQKQDNPDKKYSAAQFGKGVDDFLRGLNQLDQHPFSGDRKLLIGLGVQEGNVVTCGSLRMPPGAKRTPCAVSHSTATGRLSTHRPTWFSGGSCTAGFWPHRAAASDRLQP